MPRSFRACIRNFVGLAVAVRISLFERLEHLIDSRRSSSAFQPELVQPSLVDPCFLRVPAVEAVVHVRQRVNIAVGRRNCRFQIRIFLKRFFDLVSVLINQIVER